MIIGIDASNIRAGGGVTHLSQLLTHANPEQLGIESVVVWSCTNTLSQIPERIWLKKIHIDVLDASLPKRMLWQQFRLPGELKKAHCKVLFSPGGTLPLFSDIPAVVLSQNLLPFELHEAARYGFSLMFAKMMMVRFSQSLSMKRAKGIIFLTEYARNVIRGQIRISEKLEAIIPHGVESRFFSVASATNATSRGVKSEISILYVSIIEVYKHQIEVAEAVSILRASGLPVSLELIGSAYPPAFTKLQKKLLELDPDKKYLHYKGQLPFQEIHDAYKKADIFVFASSCENLPNILLEGMASGLAIASSNRGPMPEVLGDAGLYFDPCNPIDIAQVLKKLIENTSLKNTLAKKAFDRVQHFTWERCSSETFSFISKIGRR